MPNISVKNLSFTYKKKKNVFNVFDNFSCDFHNGKVNTIIGVSGVGKTTLLRCIMGLANYDGEIYFDDICVNNFEVSQRSISYVSQELVLYPHLNVFDNIAFPLKITRISGNEIRRRVEEVSELFGISECLTRKVKELSIGQRQRVALARALIKQSDIYILDEPFSNLDKEISRELTIELKKIFSSLNATVLFVSHDLKEAFAFSDFMYVLLDNKTVLQGNADEIATSTNLQIQELLRELKNESL